MAPIGSVRTLDDFSICVELSSNTGLLLPALVPLAASADERHALHHRLLHPASIPSAPFHAQVFVPEPPSQLGPMPAGAAAHAAVDGVVWSNNQDMHATYRLDVASGRWDDWGAMKDPMGHGISAYGMPSDIENNLYMLNFAGSEIGRLRDARIVAGPIELT